MRVIGATGADVLNSSFQRTLFLHGQEDITLHAARGDTTMVKLLHEFGCRDKYGLKKLRHRLNVSHPHHQHGAAAHTRVRRSHVAVDVGSNLGDFAIALYKKDPSMRILALEPMPHTYTFLRWNLMSNRVPLLSADAFFNRHGGEDGGESAVMGGGGVLALNMAVTSDGRNVSIEYSPHLSGFGTTSASTQSRTGPPPRTSMVSNTPDVERRTIGSLHLARWLAERRIHKLDFLKIDCEGCEHEVVPSFDPTLLQHTMAFEGEIHTCSARAGHGCHYDRPSLQKTLSDLCTSFPTGNESRTLWVQAEHSSSLSCLSWQAPHRPSLG